MDQRPPSWVAFLQSRGHEIGTHPVAKILGLADVNNFPGLIAKDVDAGFARDVLRMENRHVFGCLKIGILISHSEYLRIFFTTKNTN